MPIFCVKMELGTKSEDVRVEDLGDRIRIEDLKACQV